MRIYKRNSEFKNIERIISNYTSKGIIKLSKSKSSSRGGGGGSRSGGGAF